MVHKTALGCPSGRSPPYHRIKHCRTGKANLSIFILRLLTSGMSLAESPSFYLISFCHRISKKKNDSIVMATYTARWWGVSGFQVTRMIEWGQKSKPPKIPRASNKMQKNTWTKISPLRNPILNFRAKIIYSRNYATGIRGNYHQSSDCFEYPPKIPEKYSNQKISRNRKCQTPKNLRSSLSLEIRSTLPPRDREPSSTRWVLISLSSYLLPCYNKLNEMSSNESQNSNCFPGKRKEKSGTKISCFGLYTREC